MPLGTNDKMLRVLFWIYFSGANNKHRAWKLVAAAAATNERRKAATKQRQGKLKAILKRPRGTKSSGSREIWDIVNAKMVVGNEN